MISEKDKKFIDDLLRDYRNQFPSVKLAVSADYSFIVFGQKRNEKFSDIGILYSLLKDIQTNVCKDAYIISSAAEDDEDNVYLYRIEINY